MPLKEDVRKSLADIEDKKVCKPPTLILNQKGLQVSREHWSDKERETGDDAIKFNLDGMQLPCPRPTLKEEGVLQRTFLKSYDVNDNKAAVRRIQGELTMPKKEVQNYYLKFTDYVEVICCIQGAWDWAFV